MLSIATFSWYDVFIILALIAIPFILGGVILCLLLRAIRHSASRILLIWLVLPQSIAACCLGWGLNFYRISNSLSIILPSVSIAMLAGIAMGILLLGVLKPVTAGLIGGHLISLALFVVIINGFSPHLYAELQMGRDMHQLRYIDKSSKAFNQRLADGEFRQEMLVKAVDRRDMPLATYRGLLARGASPFQRYALKGSIFSMAAQRHNINALQVFSEQLADDNPQAESHRAFLRQDNPLDQHFYFSVTPAAEENQHYKAIVKIILNRMPELLSDRVYARILSTANAELIQFLWQYHPPEKRIYRLQAEALLGKSTLAANITAAPDILKDRPAAHSADTLWEYIVQYAPREAIQSVLKENVVQWTDYQDTKGNNRVLERAIDRAEGSHGDPQILTLVMRDILAHSRAWSPSQLAHGYYAAQPGSPMVRALYNAGITCAQLRDSLANFHAEYSVENAQQRIEEVCGP